MNARQAAYVALLKSENGECYITQSLIEWKKIFLPIDKDVHLAEEIAYGTSRLSITLDWIAKEFSDRKKLSLKVKEKVALRMALYQLLYMDKMPIYAIHNEMQKIAKKYLNIYFTKFLHALLKKIKKPVELPKGDALEALSIRYSYPKFFIKKILLLLDLNQAKKVMEAMNHPSKQMFRVRPNCLDQLEKMDGIELLKSPFAVVKDSKAIPFISENPAFYIQNITPHALVKKMVQKISPPKEILDLCAAPGGKLLTLHDFFPESELFANDVSEKRIQLLDKNFSKYGISVSVNLGLGQEYPEEKQFDLVVCDVPCSNSGVLNKRQEARYRLNSRQLKELKDLQLQLIKKATKLIKKSGHIIYMTCSILQDENEALVERSLELFGLKCSLKKLILPDLTGVDGGFAALLTCK